jgi:hypothetical protein
MPWRTNRSSRGCACKIEFTLKACSERQPVPTPENYRLFLELDLYNVFWKRAI